MKYNDRLVQKIVTLIEEDVYTITEICNALRITTKTFYEWKKEKKEFARAVQEAEDRRDDALADLARHSLREQLEGYVEVTEKIIYEDDGWDGQKMKSKIVTKKKRAPKPNIIKLALERQDKRREKEEAKNNAPEVKPFVINFLDSKDPDKTEEVLRNCIEDSRKGKSNETRQEQEEEEVDEDLKDMRLIRSVRI